MDNNQQFGSFGQVSPEGMSAIRAALERRGMGDAAPALSQQSGVSATPSAIPPSPAPTPQGGGLAPAGPTEAPVPAGSSEAEIILKAMSERLKMDSKIKGVQAGIVKGQ